MLLNCATTCRETAALEATTRSCGPHPTLVAGPPTSPGCESDLVLKKIVTSMVRSNYLCSFMRSTFSERQISQHLTNTSHIGTSQRIFSRSTVGQFTSFWSVSGRHSRNGTCITFDDFDLCGGAATCSRLRWVSIRCPARTSSNFFYYCRADSRPIRTTTCVDGSKCSKRTQLGSRLSESV